MKRIPLKGGEEFDALTSWRRVICYLDRPGVTKKIKRKYNKRFRAHAKQEIHANT